VSRALVGLLASAFAAAALAQGLIAIPPLKARVTDATGTLSATQQSQLEERLAAFETRKGSQLAVLIVPTTQPEDIAQYSIRVVDAWKLGRRGVDDGALLIIAKNDRALRIEVGRGLEGALTDATSHRIIEEIITPRFRVGDFYGGISAGLDQMMKVIDGEALPAPSPVWREPAPRAAPSLPLLFGAALLGSVVLRALFGRTLGSMLTGGGVGFLAWLFSGALAMALLAGGVAFVFALLSGVSTGARWSSPGGGGFGGFGGGGFGGGFGGGGFGGGGGFSGGGGGFAGGGSSGRW
jgi:uncharacterized protein